MKIFFDYNKEIEDYKNLIRKGKYKEADDSLEEGNKHLSFWVDGVPLMIILVWMIWIGFQSFKVLLFFLASIFFAMVIKWAYDELQKAL